VITSCKALQVIPYKNKNIADKRLISHGILHETIKYYICMERGKTREASGGNQNCQNLILFVKFELLNIYQYLPLCLTATKIIKLEHLS
jgi:hypothetical protein